MAMLTNLVPREMVAEIRSKKSIVGETRPCIQCRKVMRQVKLSRDSVDVDLEYCHHCGLCWFEGGSLVTFLRLGGIRPSHLDILEEHSPQREKQKVEKIEIRYSPQATLALFAVMLIMGILASQFTSINLTWGFAKESPFRFGGLTLFTSLFLSEKLDFITPLLFLGCGIFYERRLGAKRLLTLFVFSGVFSRVGLNLIYPDAALLQVGAIYPTIAVAAYAVFNFPFSDYLYADPNRESANTRIAIVLIGALVGFVLIYGIDIFNDQLRAALSGRGLKTISLASMVPIMGPEWIGHITAGALGLISSKRED